jgi:hypothetical protein
VTPVGVEDITSSYFARLIQQDKVTEVKGLPLSFAAEVAATRVSAPVGVMAIILLPDTSRGA